MCFLIKYLLTHLVFETRKKKAVFLTNVRIPLILNTLNNFPTIFDHIYSGVFKKTFIFMKQQLLDVKFNLVFYNEILMIADIFMTAK